MEDTTLSEQPLFCLPPELVASQQTSSAARVMSTARVMSARVMTARVMSTSSPTSRTPGMNDGLILPESYKTAPTLSRVMVAAAPEREQPLRGEIKYLFSP